MCENRGRLSWRVSHWNAGWKSVSETTWRQNKVQSLLFNIGSVETHWNAEKLRQLKIALQFHMFYNTSKFFRLAKISLHSDSGNGRPMRFQLLGSWQGRDNCHSCRFLRKRKRASGEVVVSGDPSCSWSAFWLRESCKRQQFFALFGVLIDWDSDHRTRLLTLGSKRKRQCVVLWEKNLKRYTLHIDFPSVYFPISPVFLWIQSS